MSGLIDFIVDAGSAVLAVPGHISNFSGNAATVCGVTAVGSAAIAGISALGAQIGYAGGAWVSFATAGKFTTYTAAVTAPHLMSFAVFSLKVAAGATAVGIGFAAVALVLYPFRTFTN